MELVYFLKFDLKAYHLDETCQVSCGTAFCPLGNGAVEGCFFKHPGSAPLTNHLLCGFHSKVRCLNKVTLRFETISPTNILF